MLVLIKIPCACGQQLQVTQAHAGRALQCPVCAQTVIVPHLNLGEQFPSSTPPGPASRPWLPVAGVALVILGITVGSALFFQARNNSTEPEEEKVVNNNHTPQQPTPDNGGTKPPPQLPPRLFEGHVMDLQTSLDQARRALRVDDLDEATRAIQTASKLAPNNPEVQRVLKELDQAREDQKTRLALQQLKTDKAQNEARAKDIAQQLAKLRAEKAQMEKEAEAVAKQLDNLRNQVPSDILKTARDKAQKADTQASFQKLMESGRTNLYARKYDAAVADLTLAVTIDPQSPEANSALKEAKAGQARIRQEVQKALTLLREALAVGDLKEAKYQLNTAMMLLPDDPEVLRHQYLVKNREEIQPQVDVLTKRGQDLALEGRFDEAAQVFAKAVRLVPDAPIYKQMLEVSKHASRKQTETRLALEHAEEVARTRAATHDRMRSLREHTERIIAELKQQFVAMQLHTDRATTASRIQMAGIYEQTDRMTFASGLQALGLRDQTDRMTRASSAQTADLGQQTDRMSGAVRMQMVGLMEQTDRMTGAAGLQMAGLREQTDRMTAAGLIQGANLQSQTDRMTAASGGQLRVLVDQTERMSGVSRQQTAGLMEQTDRMSGAAGMQMAHLQQQTDRMAVASRLQAASLQDQTDRMTAFSGAQLAGLREQNDRAAGTTRQQMAGLMEQTDRMTGAAGAQMTALRNQSDRAADAARLQLAGLNEQTDRMTGAASVQMSYLDAQTERMAEAARQPIVPFRVRTDLTGPPRDNLTSNGPNPGAEDQHEERQRRLREAAELKRLQTEKDKQTRDEAELKQLLADKEKLNRNALELRQLLLEKEKLDAAKQFLEKNK